MTTATATRPVTLRSQAIAELLAIRDSAAADLAVMPTAKQASEWAVDRYRDIAWCNRALARLGVDVTRAGAAGTLCTGQDESTFEETTAMGDKIVWTREDMIAATVEHWGIDDISEDDCQVIESDDDEGGTCLIVIHNATGRTSAEAGDGGRWHLDGTAYGD